MLSRPAEAKKESKMLSSIQLEQNAFDFFGSFKQLFKESLEYKKSLKEFKKINKTMKNFELQENYPFGKFSTSHQLISFKDSLKNIMYHDFISESSLDNNK